MPVKNCWFLARLPVSSATVIYLIFFTCNFCDLVFAFVAFCRSAAGLLLLRRNTPSPFSKMAKRLLFFLNRSKVVHWKSQKGYSWFHSSLLLFLDGSWTTIYSNVIAIPIPTSLWASGAPPAPVCCRESLSSWFSGGRIWIKHSFAKMKAFNQNMQMFRQNVHCADFPNGNFATSCENIYIETWNLRRKCATMKSSKWSEKVSPLHGNKKER